MRRAALLLALLWAIPAHAECTDSPAGSSARALSDTPYDVPLAEPCAGASKRSGLEPDESWTAGRDEFRSDVMRFGAIGVALGGMLLLTGASFAICAANTNSGSPGFCRAVRTPLLITGAAVSALGLGALAVGTWVLPERTPEGRAGLAAGADLRLAWDFPR